MNGSIDRGGGNAGFPQEKRKKFTLDDWIGCRSGPQQLTKQIFLDVRNAVSSFNGTWVARTNSRVGRDRWREPFNYDAGTMSFQLKGSSLLTPRAHGSPEQPSERSRIGDAVHVKPQLMFHGACLIFIYKLFRVIINWN
jgi:hypothetical protein